MQWYYILAIVVGSITLLCFGLTLLSFKMTFYQNLKNKKDTEEYPLPKGKIYQPYHPTMLKWMKETRAMPQSEFCISSFDGLKLYAKYFQCQKGNVMEIMFHGYRGNAERDLCGGIQRAFSLGHNVLLVDQRSAGKSDGKVISFGVNERKDCLSWINFVLKTFGKDQKIILTGISMGAATVLMACGYDLPKNVIGVLADCGYSDQKSIIKKCIKQMHLPANLLYPFVKLGAKIFGKFDLEEITPLQAIQNTDLPIIYFHGDTDDFVPFEMSKALFDSRPKNSKLVTVPKAGHGLCYLVDPEYYLSNLKGFFKS